MALSHCGHRSHLQPLREHVMQTNLHAQQRDQWNYVSASHRMSAFPQPRELAVPSGF